METKWVKITIFGFVNILHNNCYVRQLSIWRESKITDQINNGLIFKVHWLQIHGWNLLDPRIPIGQKIGYPIFWPVKGPNWFFGSALCIVVKKVTFSLFLMAFGLEKRFWKFWIFETKTTFWGSSLELWSKVFYF